MNSLLFSVNPNVTVVSKLPANFAIRMFLYLLDGKTDKWNPQRLLYFLKTKLRIHVRRFSYSMSEYSSYVFAN